MAKRKAIPKDVRNKVLVDAMHRCCLCPEHHDVTDLHHVVPISEGGPNTEGNLMAICPTCHAKIHRIRSRYSQDQLRMYKERWVRLCALGLPLDVRIRQAFDYTRPPTLPQMPAGIPPPPTPYFAHPYPAQAHFTGREQERADLTAWLADDEHPLLAVVAMGGMGKSALGWHWLHNDLLSLGFDHWDLRGALWWCFYDRESGFERFLERAVAYVSGGEMDAANWPVRDRMDCLRALLAERRFLLALDGAERLLRAYARMDAPYLGDEEVEAQRDVHQASLYQCADPNVGTFFQWLAGLKATKTLLTSRLLPRELEGLAGVARRGLTQMDPEDAVRFFRAMDVQGTRAEIQAACTPYGYLPLALRLLAGLVAEDPARPGDIAVATEYEITEDLRGKEQHHILERAYDALDPAARELLSRIAAFRSPVGYKVLEAIFTTPARPSQPKGSLARLFTRARKDVVVFDTNGLKVALQSLQRRGLLSRQEGTGHYDLHPVVRRYAYDRLADKEGTHTRLRDYFAAVLPPEQVESLDDLAPTIELYHHTVRAGRYDEAWDLFYDRLNIPLYYRFGAYGTFIELQSAFFVDSDFDRPLLKDEAKIAQLLNDLANCYSSSGQPGRAVPLFELCTYLDEGKDDKKNLAIDVGNLALMAQIQIGALAAAERNLRRSIALSREIGNEFNEAVGHQELGRLLAYTGAFEEAERTHQIALELAAKRGNRQIECVVRAYSAIRALFLRKPVTALEAARAARRLADLDFPGIGKLERDIIRAEWLLGAAHRARGEPAQAEPHLAEALRRCRRINLIELEPNILLELARLRHAQAREKVRRTSEVRRTWEDLAQEALEIADRCEYRLVQADCHNFLAKLALEKGDRQKAQKHAETARQRAWCDGPPHRYEVAFQEAERLLKRLEGLPE